jgi:acyl carrier protein
MTAEPARDGLAQERLLDEMVALLRKVTGEDPQWTDGITSSTRLEGDLYLDSLEMAALSDLAREAYGDRVDLAAFVSGLDIDQIIGLTVGELVAQVAAAHQAPACQAPVRSHACPAPTHSHDAGADR